MADLEGRRCNPSGVRSSKEGEDMTLLVIGLLIVIAVFYVTLEMEEMLNGK